MGVRGEDRAGSLEGHPGFWLGWPAEPEKQGEKLVIAGTRSPRGVRIVPESRWAGGAGR